MLCAAGAARADRGDFDLDRWFGILNDIRARAIAEKISPQTIDSVIQNAMFIPEALHRDQNQSEFKLTLDDYLGRTVTQKRTDAGREMARTYPTLLRRTDEKFGVPPNVILAFWGLESNYGNFKAKHKLSDAFLTLIYDGRREKFFSDQLIASMKIADNDRVPVDNLRGSWAGAMGHFQFIPTTYLQYGVDGNNDGRIDIINNVSDAMFSAGNYLSKLGWDKTQKIIRPVIVPNNFDVGLCDAKTQKTLDDWAALGVTNPDGSPLPAADMTAGIVCDKFSPLLGGSGGEAAEGGLQDNSLPQSAQAQTAPSNGEGNYPAYLTYPNFYRIKKWNNSNFYAIAIALLAEELK